MLHVLLIVIVAAVLGRDGVAGLPLLPGLEPWNIPAMVLLPALLLAALQHLALLWCGRVIDRTGSWRAVAAADWTLLIVRIAAVVLHVAAIVGLGWLDAVRALIGGNLIALDELLAAAPPLAVFIAGWASFYPVDRRLREAAIVQALDQGRPLPSLPTRAAFVLDCVRSNALVVLVPVLLIASWGETVDRLLPSLPGLWSDPGTPQGAGASTAAHLLGVAIVLAIMPLVLRRVWDTVPMGPGPLRDRLMDLCIDQGVRCRELLVWRTHTRMLNGAVVGVVPWLRYILLTDALLETLSGTQVEAVMAHEVAHARRHHMPWLMASILASVSLAWPGATLAMDLGARALGKSAPTGPWLELGAALLAGGGCLWLFGWISRRFEEQADAFAAQHLSGRVRIHEGRRDVLITAEAAGAMSSALGAVALENRSNPARFSFRHGSIASRRHRLKRLVGLPAHALPIDALVRWIKRGTLVAGTAAVVMAFVSWRYIAGHGR